MPSSPLVRTLRDCFDAPMRRPMRSLDLLRVAVAVLLLVHPLHAFLHPEDRLAMAQAIGAHGISVGMGLAWATLLIQTAASLALLTGRFVAAACVAHIALLSLGIVFVQAPYWYVVGGAVVDGHRGMEFNLLAIACLLGLLWGRRDAAKGLDLVRVAAALILITHPLHGFYDYKNLGGFGHFLDHLAFGHGLALVYTMLATQTLCCAALLPRRVVVPACAGHIFILGTGIWLAHWPDWFVVGPGTDGMEYSVLFIACFAGLLLAHWPRTDAVPELMAEALAD